MFFLTKCIALTKAMNEQHLFFFDVDIDDSNILYYGSYFHVR